MAIVPDLSGNNPLDKSYTYHNRVNAGTPNAVLTSEYAGEIVFDTTNKVRWKALNRLSNSSWIPIDTEVT